MQSTRQAIALVYAIGLSLWLITAPIPGAGQPHNNPSLFTGSPCNAVIKDDTKTLNLSDKKLISAASTLSQHSFLRVRIVKYVNGDPYELEPQMESDCPSWLGPDGVTIFANFIGIILIAPGDDRDAQPSTAEIYYGEKWDAALEPVYSEIETTLISPWLQAGDTTKALSAGINALSQKIATPEGPSLPFKIWRMTLFMLVAAVSVTIYLKSEINKAAKAQAIGD